MSGFERSGRRAVLLLLMLLPAVVGAASLTNQLARNPSPYLALHGADPVAWQEWNAETIARARRENKLLFVSVGYFACHWCHVMQRESYKNPQIAALLNRSFIPVKVDRELNSGLDEALQQFSGNLNGVAGWPLNAFVTPEGYPAFVMLYAPPDEFRARLTQLTARWAAEAASIRQLAQRAAASSPSPPISVAVTPATAARAAQQFTASAAREADMLRGGFGEVSKFPMAPQLDGLLDELATKPNPKQLEFLRLTFDQMAARGLHDHVGGGFFRYTTDPGWDTPHFEKMLYDNAHLASLYLRAAVLLNAPHYREMALRTLDFMLRDLRDASGGFYSSTSAVDRAGREGATYLWEPTELKRLLEPSHYAAARRVWQLDAPRVFELGYLPAEWQTPTPAERRLLSETMPRLLKARAQRELPKDNKMNAGLNGLALTALSQAAVLDPAYRQAADRLQQFLLKRLMYKGRLMKSFAAGRLLDGAELEDYAYVAQGLLDHAAATGNMRSRAAAAALVDRAWALFWHPAGWRREAHPLLATVQPEPVLADGALASPSETLLLASLRVTGASAQRAARVAGWSSIEMTRDPFAYASRVKVLRRVAR